MQINPGCTRCALHQTAKHVCIGGRGAVPADLLIYGHNPGAQENRLGEPFIGEAGTLLTRMLREVDSSISIRFSNVVKCFPPENRKPSLTEQEACRPYILQEILEVKPTAILALGNEALVSLTGQGGVNKKRDVPTDLRSTLRQQLLSSGHYANMELPKVLATWHPAYILFNRSHQFELENSIAAAVRYIKSMRGEEQGQTIEWQEWASIHDINELVDEAENTNGLPVLIGYDIETNALPFNHPNFKIWMIGISNGQRSLVARRDTHTKLLITWLQELQRLGKITLVGYNSVSFDDVATKLCSQDTLYLDYLVDEGVSSYTGRGTGRHKLQSSVVRHLQIPPWKDEVTWDWGEFDLFGKDWPTAALYNARDALYTVKDYAILSKRLTEKQKLLVEHIMQPAGRFLANLEQRGVPISHKNLQAVKLEVEVAREKALDTLMRQAFRFDLWTFNPNSPPQVRTLLFEKLKLQPVLYSSSNTPSTDEETLRSLLLTYGDEPNTLKTLESLLAYRRENKLLTTYINKCTPEADGRIHASYSLTQTVTGRTTSYGWSPQRLPRDKRLRRLVAAPPGMKLISADLSQIEMRTMAFLSREPNMLAVYKDGLYDGDMHNYMAGQLAKRRGLDTWTPEDRQLAKPLNFALLYGAEWFTVQSYLLQEYGIIMSQKDIKHIRDDIFFGSAFPGLPEYFNKVIRQAQLDGGVEGTFGLRRQLPNINVRDISLKTAAAREAINTDNQGLASYLALIGCFLLDKEAGSVVEQVAFIHDATLALVREVDVDIASQLIKRIFEKQIQEYVASVFGIDFDVPIKIDIKVGASWGDN